MTLSLEPSQHRTGEAIRGLQVAPLGHLLDTQELLVWGRAHVSQTHIVYPLDFSIHMNQVIHEPTM